MKLPDRISRRKSLIGAFLGVPLLGGAAKAAPAVPALHGGHPLHVSAGPPLTVRDGSTTVYPTSVITFSGATVTNGGAGEALVAISGGSSGLVPVSGQSVSIVDGVDAPVILVAAAIPVTGSRFLLTWDNLRFTTGDDPSLAFSFDGGVTYLCDATHSDSYITFGQQNIEGGSPLNPSGSDSLMLDLIIQDTDTFPCSGQCWIFPGGSTSFSRIKGEMSTCRTGTSYSVDFESKVNVNANVTPTAARATHIAIVAYGSGNINPPGTGTGNTIKSVDLALWKMVTA